MNLNLFICIKTEKVFLENDFLNLNIFNDGETLFSEGIGLLIK